MREGGRWLAALERQATVLQTCIDQVIESYRNAGDVVTATEELAEEHEVYVVLLDHAPQCVLTEHAARFLGTG